VGKERHPIGQIIERRNKRDYQSYDGGYRGPDLSPLPTGEG
jgi:hypothetical protein